MKKSSSIQGRVISSTPSNNQLSDKYAFVEYKNLDDQDIVGVGYWSGDNEEFTYAIVDYPKGKKTFFGQPCDGIKTELESLFSVFVNKN